MRRGAVAAILLALIAASCTSPTVDPGDVSASSGEPDAADGDNAPLAIAPDVPHPSDTIFDQDRLHTFELTLSEEALAELDADPAAEEYVEGALTFEGTTVEPVGIRYKGSIGAWVGCLSSADLFEPSGSKTCTKLSMKVKLNWEDPDDGFFGLRRLQFHSQNLDPSQMHERLGYWLFRQMGVPAPRSVHARLVVNGQYVGLFALTEQIDGRFTRRNFADGTGNLYKEVWPLTDSGESQPSRVYRDGLETNEDENPSFDRIRSFAEEVAADGADALTRWTNVDELMAFAAVDRAIRNDDGPFHWYCFDPNPCSSHNFYWYEEPTVGTLHLIPWDLDNAFENILFDANPVTPIGDDWGEVTAECRPYAYGAWGLLQRSAACDPLVAAMVTFEREYEAARAELFSGPMSEAVVDAQLEAWSDQIAAATAEAAAAHDDAVSVDRWRSHVDALRRALDHARSAS